MREEHRTSWIRGLGCAAVAGALVFFTQWPLDPGMKALISSTAVAALVPLGAFLGLGERDARRNDGKGNPTQGTSP